MTWSAGSKACRRGGQERSQQDMIKESLHNLFRRCKKSEGWQARGERMTVSPSPLWLSSTGRVCVVWCDGDRQAGRPVRPKITSPEEHQSPQLFCSIWKFKYILRVSAGIQVVESDLWLLRASGFNYIIINRFYYSVGVIFRRLPLTTKQYVSESIVDPDFLPLS